MEDPTAGLQLHGKVTRFKGNGRRLGYPTANLDIETAAKDGVYFGWSDLAGFKARPSIIFVGVPTTVGDTKRRVEAHLLDIPDEDYYDLPLSLRLGPYHRANQTFAGTSQLISAMKDDEAAAREWFRLRKGV